MCVHTYIHTHTHTYIHTYILNIVDTLQPIMLDVLHWLPLQHRIIFRIAAVVWGAFWALLRPTSEIFAIPPWALEVAVPSDQWNGGYSLYCDQISLVSIRDGVLGENGRGQNGTDKMVRTKWRR